MHLIHIYICRCKKVRGWKKKKHIKKHCLSLLKTTFSNCGDLCPRAASIVFRRCDPLWACIGLLISVSVWPVCSSVSSFGCWVLIFVGSFVIVCSFVSGCQFLVRKSVGHFLFDLSIVLLALSLVGSLLKKICSTSPPRGNQVDGLPWASRFSVKNSI